MRFVALFVLAAACGDNFSAADFPGEQRDATCGYYVRCGSFATISECRTFFMRNEPGNPSLEAAIDAGRIHYSGAAAEACIEALDKLECDVTLQGANALAACEDVYTGTGNVGDPCAFDGECESERCQVPTCDDACCQGTCQEPRIYPGPGEACSTVCDEGLFCGLDEICHYELGPGEPCSFYTVCAYGLHCSGQTQVCTAAAATGAICEGYCALEGDVCGPDMRCAPAAVGGDNCSTSMECSHFYICNIDYGKCMLAQEPVRQPNGAPCTFGADCQSRYCDGVCRDVPICF